MKYDGAGCDAAAWLDRPTARDHSITYCATR